MGTLSGLLDRLESEIGYVEKASNNDLDSKTGNKGLNNYTKYSRDVNNAGLMGCQGQPWCATFQFWAELMEFGRAQALKNWNMSQTNYCGYSCFSTYDKFKEVGKIGMTPKLGALVIFTFSHMGRVTKIYADGSFDCLEGNTSSKVNDRNGGMVVVKKRKVDTTIKGFCYITYSDEVEAYPRWIKSGDKWYYRLSSNTNAHNWQVINGHWYFFDSNGEMFTGLHHIDGKAYYFAEKEVFGENIEGALCESDESGALQVWNL